MQGDNNLTRAMHQNIAVMKLFGSTKKINLLVQWDEPNTHTTWRYKIGKNEFLDNASIKQDMGINPEQEVIDAANWAFKKYPAQHFMLSLWNHGSGILDEKKDWEKRGILYDFSSKKCLTNAGLLRALRSIKQDALSGQKFDVIGMDACLMAMVEIAHQLHDFGKFFVASENLTYAPGWNYEEILGNLTNPNKKYTPHDLAQLIVSSFASLHSKNNTSYTQSLVNLEKIPALTRALSGVAQELLATPHVHLSSVKKALVKSHKACTKFENDQFVDLFDFLRLIQKNIPIARQKKSALNQCIEKARKCLINAIVCHARGASYHRAHGLSIYLPPKEPLHGSYYDTLFAQESAWPSFLKLYTS